MVPLYYVLYATVPVVASYPRNVLRAARAVFRFAMPRTRVSPGTTLLGSEGNETKLHARLLFTEQSMPASLAVARQRQPLGAAFFLAQTGEEALMATFATWNMLDAIMWSKTQIVRNGSRASVGGAHAWQTGYVREV